MFRLNWKIQVLIRGLLCIVIKPESIRSSSNKWTKTYSVVPRLFTSYCKLLYDCDIYLLKEIISTITKLRKCWTSNETFESPGEMKLMMKILPVFAQFLWISNLFFSFPLEIVSVLFQVIVYIFSFKKRKKNFKILKIILVLIFVH